MSKKANSKQAGCFEISFLINILSITCDLLEVNIVRQETDSLSVMCLKNICTKANNTAGKRDFPFSKYSSNSIKK